MEHRRRGVLFFAIRGQGLTLQIQAFPRIINVDIYLNLYRKNANGDRIC